LSNTGCGAAPKISFQRPVPTRFVRRQRMKEWAALFQDDPGAIT
jgi:hypothetical protein